nr:MAG TPA: Cbb3-type cytochrome c oxidase subunit [Caudoviricetes sp.]
MRFSRIGIGVLVLYVFIRGFGLFIWFGLEAWF